MSSERDLERAVRTWLSDGLETLPDRYLDAALDEISTTNQRRRGPSAWRPSEMNTFARFGLAAAAVLVVAIVGWTVLVNGGPRIGGPIPSSSSTPTATPTATASPTPTPPTEHRSTTGFAVPFTYDVPKTWTSTAQSPNGYNVDNETDQAGFYGISPMSAPRLYADPCRPSKGLLPQPGAKPADLAQAVSQLPGLTVSAPVPVTVNGQTGVSIDFHYTGDAANCETAGKISLAQVDPGNNDQFYAAQVELRWIILDIRGKRLVLELWSAIHPLAERLPELQRIVDSIKFS